MKHYDFVSIGDTVTDAFIKLHDAYVMTDHDHGKQICMNFGDKIPYEEVIIVPAVGNSANASVAAARLGLKSALVSNIGDDYFGKECLGALKKEKVDTEFIKRHKGMKTNYHYVLMFKEERTILIKHEEYEYKLPNIGVPKWVYFSSVGENAEPFHREVENYLTKYPEINLAFQPGTYQIKLGVQKLSGLYKRIHLFFCNKEEAQRILATKTDDIKELLQGIHATGPKIPVITDGINGAYAYDGTDTWFMPTYPDPKPPISRTGAGDSFSSTFTVALALGHDIPTALKWGPINSMSVVQKIGARAGLVTREQLEEYLKNAPADYVPRKI